MPDGSATAHLYRPKLFTTLGEGYDLAKFRKDVLAAQKVMDQHWDTEGRSIALINNPRTLLDTPIATVTNLKAALDEIGASIDIEQDVVMVYLASHGSASHVFEISLRPLSSRKSRHRHCARCSMRPVSSGASLWSRPVTPVDSSMRSRTITRW